MSLGEAMPPARPREEPRSSAGARRRWWAIGGVLVTAAFVAWVVLSARSASVPVGGSMPDMATGTGRFAVTMRDVSDRAVRLPGGRPAVVVVSYARDCASCVGAVRAARDAVRAAADRAQLVVVMADAGTSRGDVGAFARSVGRSPARYVIDDRSGGLASMLGASGLASAVVYDARGRVVARPQASASDIAAALRRAGR